MKRMSKQMEKSSLSIQFDNSISLVSKLITFIFLIVMLLVAYWAAGTSTGYFCCGFFIFSSTLPFWRWTPKTAIINYKNNELIVTPYLNSLMQELIALKIRVR